VIDNDLQTQLGSTGEISVIFHRVMNPRRKAARGKLPAMYQYEKVPEKAMEGSSVSYKTRYARSA
jgi:hypothetical protein